MPHYQVHLDEDQLDSTTGPRLIAELTEAVVSVYGEFFRPLVAIDLLGIPSGRRGLGGVVATENAPSVTLHLREAAFSHPDHPRAPERMIAAITDAVTAVYGEEVRPRVGVRLVGIPAGRSGQGGEVR
ncbi:hypothetical protein [Streptomyces carpaticus]|uniref:4-oxalocrotonate tautomerase domain-containing protein n=1 Tax=Streptomyces carpaticus TaxID=285558 RepID=A0ABV4ZQZ3_9ACTN